MLEVKTKEIEGMVFKVQQFAGRKNLDLLVDLAAFVGPAVAAAVPSGATKGSLLDSDLDVSAISNALMLNMNSGKVGGLVMRMLGSTFCNDRAIDDAQFDVMFAGQKLWLLPKVLTFVIEVNYGNFSALVGNVSGVLGNQAAPQTPAN